MSPQRQETERRGWSGKLCIGHDGLEESVGKGTIARGVQGLGDHLEQEVEAWSTHMCVYLCACACVHLRVCVYTHTEKRQGKEGRFVYEQNRATQVP